MIDFGSVMKIKNAWDTFNRNHPKFMPFCQAVGRDGIGVDTIRSEERRVGKECRSRWSIPLLK